jgi:REP element-mobilizing transposase RayT
MPTIDRCDHPGAWHHVMNRGIAKRPLFETEGDYARFIEELEAVSRAGLVEIHSACLMPNHFHALVRSPRGALSQALKQIQSRYAIQFNLNRDRDGPLVRARFRSKPVAGDEYLFAVVRYIDTNPVRAGICDIASDYPYGSARHYVHGSRPAWLTTDYVEKAVMSRQPHLPFDPKRYLDAFQLVDEEAAFKVVEHRIASRRRGFDRVAEVRGRVDLASQWLRHRALLADGALCDLRSADPERILRVTAAHFEKDDDPLDEVRPAAIAVTRAIVEVALLRELAICTFREIGTFLGMDANRAVRLLAKHRERCVSNTSYVALCAELVVTCTGALRRRIEVTRGQDVSRRAPGAAEAARETSE